MSVRDLPMIENDDTILFAILIQNAKQPKNAQRVAAVKEGAYHEIRTHDEAVEYLSELLRTHMTHEL